MRRLETIKIANGRCQNLAYHERRCGFALTPPPLAPLLMQGVVKWRVVYQDGAVVEQSIAPYTLPQITSLQLVACDGIEYDQKYEDRSAINALFEQRGSCDDILIVRRGKLTDSSFCNLVFENREGLFTPSTPLLRGTKRQLLLDRGVIAEREITADDLALYDRVHLINAMVELEDNITITLR